MPKFLLLKNYNGGPTPMPNCVPMSEWAPEDIATHIDFQRHVIDLLTDSGEFVDAQALTPTGNYVRYGGPDAAPVVTDGPFPEAKELIAGWFMVDVVSKERAHEIAAYVSSAPGYRGEPVEEWLEVREVMSEPSSPDA